MPTPAGLQTLLVVPPVAPLSVRKIPPSLPTYILPLVAKSGAKTIACWSAWAKGPGLEPVHQNDASAQVVPPSLERNKSMPPAHTRLGFVGSTAMTLSYQPWLKMESDGPKPHSA